MVTEPSASQRPEYVLTIVCPDRPGIVFAVSSFLVQHSGNILESQQFDDRLDEQFFMRVHFEIYRAADDLESLRAAFSSVADAYSMTWQMWPAAAKCRVEMSRLGEEAGLLGAARFALDALSSP